MDFPEYVFALKRAVGDAISDEDIVNLILLSIIDPAGIKGKDGERYHIDKGSVSKILDGRTPIPSKIIEGITRQKVRESMPLYFEQELIPILGPDNLRGLNAELLQLIHKDSYLQSGEKQELIEQIESGDLKCLAFCLAKILQIIIALEASKKRSKNEINKLKRKPLPDVEIPAIPEQEEARYVNALFDVYSESTGKNIDSAEKLKTYSSSYKSHFDRQRRDFYNAECLRRNSRDVYLAEEKNPFDVFVDDTFDGVIDTWEKDYPSGMDRLTGVLDKATSLKHTRSVLSSETQWIGPSQQKGICHILVNDSRLDGWIKKKNEQ